VGVISSLFPFLTLYANWATSFPAQVELPLAGNPLKSETGEQFEGGARFKLLQDWMSLNLAYFHITEFNVALAQANGYIFQGNRLIDLFASYGYTT
jgi:iron complex outermembrane receptor protein